MEWIEIVERLPISTVAIMGLSYACWNIYKDTQVVTSRKTNSEIASVNAQFALLVNDIQDKVNIIFERIK